MKTEDALLIGGAGLLGLGLLNAKGDTLSEKSGNLMSGFATAIPSQPIFNIISKPVEAATSTAKDFIINLQLPESPISQDASKTISRWNPFNYVPSLPDYTNNKHISGIGEAFDNTLNTAKVIAGAYVGGKTAQAVGKIAGRTTTRTIITKTVPKVVAAKVAKSTSSAILKKGVGTVLKGAVAGEIVGNVAVAGVRKVQEATGWGKIQTPLPASIDNAIRSFASIFRW